MDLNLAPKGPLGPASGTRSVALIAELQDCNDYRIARLQDCRIAMIAGIEDGNDCRIAMTDGFD